jgi:hypothetical protein
MDQYSPKDDSMAICTKTYVDGHAVALKNYPVDNHWQDRYLELEHFAANAKSAPE